MDTRIARNIPIMYALKSARWFMLAMPIIVVFYQDNGLSMQQILALQSFFSLALLLLDLPTGYIADSLGRKTSILLGCGLGVIGQILMLCAHDFWFFLLAQVTLAGGSAFVSGADAALRYDTLAALDRKDEYAKVESRGLFAQSLSECIASVIGGALAGLTLRTPLIGQLFMFILALAMGFFLIEPEVEHAKLRSSQPKQIYKTLVSAFQEQPALAWLIFYFSIITSATLSMTWFIQPFFIHTGLPLKWFGVTWAALNLFLGLVSLQACRIEKLLGQRLFLISLTPLVALSYLLLVPFNTVWAILFLLIIYFVRGITGPIMLQYLNERTNTEIRATMLSAGSTLSRLLFVVFGPVLGWIADISSVQTTFLCAGVFFAVLGSGCLMGLLRSHKGAGI